MSGAKILIIDDEVDLARLLAYEIRKRGYQVITATNGEEGLERVRSEKPDLIFFDIKMPKMDGYTFVKTIKKDPAFSSIPLVALTAYDMKEMFEIEGVNEYFLKSASLDSVFETINKYCPPGEAKS